MANSEYNAKNIKKAFSERGCFYTDSRLAELMMAELGETDEVVAKLDEVLNEKK